VVNAAGRSGAYFIPAGPRSRPMPLLVLMHGTNGTGAGIIAAFRGLAQERHFAIVAPDSRRVTIAPPDPRPPGDYYTWEVGDHPGEVTPDLTHTISCIEWVRSHTGLAVDLTHVLIAGYSGGGSSAPYIGSNRPPFTHIAILHGGVFTGGLGPRRTPVWLSTGLEDPLRPVDQVRQSASAFVGLGFRPMSYRSYPGGHGLSEAEVRDLIVWWLGP
jgi:predicted esterase